MKFHGSGKKSVRRPAPIVMAAEPTNAASSRLSESMWHARCAAHLERCAAAIGDDDSYAMSGSRSAALWPIPPRSSGFTWPGIRLIDRDVPAGTMTIVSAATMTNHLFH
jgi:hypothetical protein